MRAAPLRSSLSDCVPWMLKMAWRYIVFLIFASQLWIASVRCQDTSFVKYVHVGAFQYFIFFFQSNNLCILISLEVSMNHLDVGFDGINPTPGFGYNVVNKYFDVCLLVAPLPFLLS